MISTSIRRPRSTQSSFCLLGSTLRPFCAAKRPLVFESTKTSIIGARLSFSSSKNKATRDKYTPSFARLLCRRLAKTHPDIEFLCGRKKGGKKRACLSLFEKKIGGERKRRRRHTKQREEEDTFVDSIHKHHPLFFFFLFFFVWTTTTTTKDENIFIYFFVCACCCFLFGGFQRILLNMFLYFSSGGKYMHFNASIASQY